MNRYAALGLTSLFLASSLSISGSWADAKNRDEPGGAPRAQQQAQMAEFRAQQQQQRAGQEASMRAAEESARSAQEQAMKQQQQQAREMQEQQAKQQQQQERQVEQQQARQQQQQERQAEQQQARQQQQQERQAEQQQARQQQQQERQAEQQQARRQQQQERQMQQQQAREQQEQSRVQQQQAKTQERETQRQANAQPQETRREQNALGAEGRGPAGIPPENRTAMMERESTAFGAQEHGFSFNKTGMNMRPAQAMPMPAHSALPLTQARSMPVLDENFSAAEKEHAQAVVNNLQAHLYAVQPQYVPQNVAEISNFALNNYLHNYQAVINNQVFAINAQNTFFNPVPQYEYPAWYQPTPGWVFSNGCTLGNSFNIGLDWLRWGWHPYYGPQPEGFVCAQNYVPTPWIYFPAYGLWRIAGVQGWAPSGPPFDYTGPISVEVLEPRRINVSDPYSLFQHSRTINVVYLYNAFFYPQYERWGYLNRHNNFIFVNL